MSNKMQQKLKSRITQNLTTYFSNYMIIRYMISNLRQQLIFLLRMKENIILPHDAVSYLVNPVLVVLLHIEELSQFVKN